MANGHVEIYDPISNSNGHVGTSDDAHSTSSDASRMEDTEEYRILMAYAKRRRPRKQVETDVNGTTPSRTLTPSAAAETPKKKKKKGWKRVLSVFRCVKPQTDDKQTDSSHSDVNERLFSGECHSGEEEEEEDENEVANRLTRIADKIKLTPSEWETDTGKDDVEKIIGLLLREQGDKFNEKLKEANIGSELFLNYSFFERLMNNFLIMTGFKSSSPNGLGPQASPTTQMALACEVTSRLSAVDTLPTNRLLYHGARYLQVYYSSWAQNQGGYEAAIEHDDEEVE